ncbi:HIT family protein [Oxyplasma meridianum]|uniref:HIT family protein n=1 Tax=Oxyplasma meridianum TaxID=3073602 RepID=A0AAX4NIR9_9ARCH
MNQKSCVFCTEIVTKRNAAIIYEDDLTMAFMDNAPVEQGHVLVIPKSHYSNILDIPVDIYSAVHLVARKLAPAILLAINAEALNIGQNNGRCANQRVMHYHLHMIPRKCGREIEWIRKILTTEELKQTSQKIKKTLDGEIDTTKIKIV